MSELRGTGGAPRRANWVAIIGAAVLSALGSYIVAIKVTEGTSDKATAEQFAVMKEIMARMEKKIDGNAMTMAREIETLTAADARMVEQIVENAKSIAVMEERQSRYERHLEKEHQQ